MKFIASNKYVPIICIKDDFIDYLVLYTLVMHFFQLSQILIVCERLQSHGQHEQQFCFFYFGMVLSFPMDLFLVIPLISRKCFLHSGVPHIWQTLNRFVMEIFGAIIFKVFSGDAINIKETFIIQQMFIKSLSIAEY